MKHHHCSKKDERSSSAGVRPEPTRRRPIYTIIFAAVLVSLAATALAQEPATGCQQCGESSLSFDGRTPAAIQGGAVALRRSAGDARPTYAQLAASLSNFDSDAAPDGWRAEVVLRDRQDRPVVMRAHATFELTPRVPTAWGLRYVDADTRPIRWSMPLDFDEDSVARVRLPLRKSLQPMLGWSVAIYPPSRTRSRDEGHNIRGLSRHRSFVTSDVRNLVGRPSTGELRVRVSVPTEGVFEAAVPVRIRPSVLVDTKWPYR